MLQKTLIIATLLLAAISTSNTQSSTEPDTTTAETSNPVTTTSTTQDTTSAEKTTVTETASTTTEPESTSASTLSSSAASESTSASTEPTSTATASASSTTEPESTSASTLSSSAASESTSASTEPTSTALTTLSSISTGSVASTTTGVSSGSSSSTAASESTSTSQEPSSTASTTSLSTSTGSVTSTSSVGSSSYSSTTVGGTSTVTTTIPALISTCSCTQNAYCTPIVETNGSTSYTCTCNPGYIGNGYANGNCSLFNPAAQNVLSYSLRFNISGFSDDVLNNQSSAFATFASSVQSTVDGVLKSTNSNYAAGSSRCTNAIRGSLIASMTSVLGISSSNPSPSAISDSITSGIVSSTANLQSLNTALAAIGYSGTLTAEMISVSNPLVLSPCLAVACPSPTICTEASNGTAQCLCPSGNTVTGWTNTFTQSCQQTSETNMIIAIVLPIVFGVVGIQVILFIICVVRRKRAQNDEKKMNATLSFNNGADAAAQSAPDILGSLDLPRPRFEYYRNPALTWKTAGTRKPLEPEYN